MSAPAAAETGTLLALDTATSRVVVARGGFDGTLADAAGWPAGYRHGESLLPAIERLLAPAGGRTAIGAVVVGTGPGRSPDCASGSRPPRAWPTAWVARSSACRRAWHCWPPRRGRARCCCPPDPPTACWSVPASRRGCCPAAPNRSSRSGERLVAVDLDGRAPEDALERGRVAHDGLAAALLRLGAERLAADEPRGRPRGARPRLRDAAARRDRDDRGGGMVARPPVKLTIARDADRRPGRRAGDRARELQLARGRRTRIAASSRRTASRTTSWHGSTARSSATAGCGSWSTRRTSRRSRSIRAWRRQRIGERLLLAFLDLAVERQAHEATLEVRLSNLAARRLYEKYGFRPVGLRPRYYSDDNEDALIMTTEPLAEPRMRERLTRLRAELDAAPSPRRPGDPERSATCPRRPRAARPAAGRSMSGPLVLALESSCDETGIAIVEGGRRIHANVVASQVALHAATGGIVPEVAARAHLRWIVPVLDEAWAGAGVTWDDIDAVAVTYGPGLAGSLLVGHQLRQGPRLGPRQAAGRREPPRGPRLRGRGCSTRARPSTPNPAFPLVALVVSGGHTFLAEMRDHLTYRLLGQTVDDAAGEAFDKVGRLLGLGYPGGPAIQRAAEAATAPRSRSSRGPGSVTRTTSASPGSRPRRGGSIEAARADAGLADEPDAPLPDPLVAELAWGFQDAVVDVLATKTIRAAREVGARSIVLGGGVAANAALRDRLAGEAAGARPAADRAATRPVHRQRGDDRGRRRAPVRGRGTGRAGSRRATLAAAGDALGGPARSTRATSGTRSGPPGLRARHALSQNFLADPEVLEAILAEADPAPGPARSSRSVPGSGSSRAACSTAARRSPRSSSIVAWPPSCASASRPSSSEPGEDRRAGGLRLIEGDALDQDLAGSSSRRTTSSPTCRTTSRARSSTRCSARRRAPRASCSWSSARSPNGSPRRPGR